jgi:hypothetical protein
MSQEDSALVEEVKAQLNEIDSAELSEHAERFEALHEKLSNALNSIDGL